MRKGVKKGDSHLFFVFSKLTKHFKRVFLCFCIIFCV